MDALVGSDKTKTAIEWLNDLFSSVGEDSRGDLRWAAVPRRSKAVVDAVPPTLARLGITGREIDVLLLVAHGATNREAAEKLFISVRTVDKHVERLLFKTGTRRTGLAVVARDAGLLRT